MFERPSDLPRSHRQELERLLLGERSVPARARDYINAQPEGLRLLLHQHAIESVVSGASTAPEPSRYLVVVVASTAPGRAAKATAPTPEPAVVTLAAVEAAFDSGVFEGARIFWNHAPQPRSEEEYCGYVEHVHLREMSGNRLALCGAADIFGCMDLRRRLAGQWSMRGLPKAPGLFRLSPAFETARDVRNGIRYCTFDTVHSLDVVVSSAFEGRFVAPLPRLGAADLESNGKGVDL